MPAPPTVAIVILNWNGRGHLEQFLPSVLKTAYPALQIVVADNASADDSILFLQTHYPQVNVIRLTENHGFARGYNRALAQVTADYFVLLNSDVQVSPNWLLPLIELLESDTNIAAVQPKIKAYTNKAKFEYAGAAGGWIDAFGYPFARGRIFDICEDDHQQFDDAAEVFWATGAAMVIRSHLYRQAHGFDEYFFAHQEEIDLCWRLQLAGYKIFVCPQSEVYHVGGGTLPRGNSKKTFLNFRNNQIMLAKNLPWSEKWWKIPYRLLLDQVSAMKGLLGGDPGYFLSITEAHLAFFYWLVFGNKKWKAAKRKPLTQLRGVYNGNLVWAHFVKKKARFAEIVVNKK